MAAFIRGLNDNEMTALTQAMTQSVILSICHLFPDGKWINIPQAEWG